MGLAAGGSSMKHLEPVTQLPSHPQVMLCFLCILAIKKILHLLCMLVFLLQQREFLYMANVCSLSALELNHFSYLD